MIPSRVDWVWVAIGLAGGAVAFGSLLPAFELAIEAYTVDASSRQTGYRYRSEVAFGLDLLPLGLVPPVAALVLVAAAVVAIRDTSRWSLAVCALGLTLVLGVLVVDTSGRLGWSEIGVIGYEEPHGGPLLQPALDELVQRAQSSPEARDPSWTLLGGEHGYAARGTTGWNVLVWSTLALYGLTTYRAARSRLGRRGSLALVAAAIVLLFVWLFWRALEGLE